MRLSKRLEAVAAFVPQGSCLADIGTDHGYLPIFLVEQGICKRAVAMDVGKGPLERAKAHIKEYGFEDRITTRLSDGLTKLEPGEADTVTIAGMGGELIIKILDEGRGLWPELKQFILSPQSELHKVRKFLALGGFEIREETMVCEDEKYYTVMSVSAGHMEPQTESEYLYGRKLIEKKDPVLAEYLRKEKERFLQVAAVLQGQETRGALQAKEEIAWQLKLIEEAEHEMQGTL